MKGIPSWRIRSLIETALAEDIGSGDITTSSIFPEPVKAEGRIRSKEECIVAGAEIAREVFFTIDQSLALDGTAIADGSRVKPGDTVLFISGDGRTILKGERVALNFLQRLSGIATLTSKYLEAIDGFDVKILDTRKTTPGLRDIEKGAIRIGGGYNHRFSLSQAVLIKDNHIMLAGGISEAIARVKRRITGHLNVEVEVSSPAEAEEAFHAGADMILLDNMGVESIREVVKTIDRRIPIEVSGGVDLLSVREIARAGVDYISIGALTHSARAVDMSMDIVPSGGQG
ncbi:MAG TPA: carboxylating nicotinate-nucleotide diphosphorylase [Nitrospiria bacterium]|nr:carboxylating nicotinate-nucleotide diphosphorylase [Nitrospiria bacterium]